MYVAHAKNHTHALLVSPSVRWRKLCVGHIRDDGVLISRINYSSMRQIKIFPSIFFPALYQYSRFFLPLLFLSSISLASVLFSLLVHADFSRYFTLLIFFCTLSLVHFIPVCKMLIFFHLFIAIFSLIIFHGKKMQCCERHEQKWSVVSVCVCNGTTDCNAESTACKRRPKTGSISKDRQK